MAAKISLKETFLTNPMNQRIRVLSRIPRKTMMQLIVVHGFAEHAGCYDELSRLLAAEGIAVHMLDLPGHGFSDGARGHIGHFSEFLDTVHLVFQNYPHFEQTKPAFLLGHSLGGLISALYCLRRKPDIRGLVLCSPLTGFEFPMSLVTKAVMKTAASRDPALLFPKPSGVTSLTRDPRQWQRNRNDPVRLRTISPNLYLSMVQQAEWLQHHADELSVPLLLFYSIKDRVVSPGAIRQFFANTGSGDKSSVVFTQAMHELLQEQERDLILDKIQAWMSERL